MKKVIPVLAVLGSAVAFAVYKLKKEEQAQLMDLDEGLLEDEDIDFHPEEADAPETPVYEDEPVSESVKSEPTEPEEEPIIKEEEPDFATTEKSIDIPVSDIQQLLKEAAAESELREQMESMMRENEAAMNAESQEITEETEEAEDEADDMVDEEIYNAHYPHLTNRMIDDINMMTKEAIEALAKDGDVHSHERPVQHMVSFRNKEDLESFKNRAINKGFVITKGEEECDLIVLHISAIDEEKLVSHILYLADQAYAFNGEYRGWQSKVSF